MTKKNRTKKQHYIAQCLLKTFFESDKIICKNVKDCKVYQSSIDDSMCKNNSYEFVLFEDNWLEDIFANNVDGKSNEIIKETIKKLNNNMVIDAVDIIKNNIGLLLINYFKSLTSLIHMSSNMDKPGQDSIARLVDRIANESYINRIGTLLNTEYKIAFIKSNTGKFILSDQYISTCAIKFNSRLVNVSNRNIGMKDTLVLIPLNKYYYVAFVAGELPYEYSINYNSINILSDDYVFKINEIIYNNSYEKVASFNIDTVSILKKNNSSFGDSLITVGFNSGNNMTYKVKQEVFFTKEEYEMYEYYCSNDWAKKEYIKCKVNQKCPCGSNLKYKKCCKNKVDRCLHVFYTIHHKKESLILNNELGFEEDILI